MQFKKGRQNYIYSQLDPKNGALLLELSSALSWFPPQCAGTNFILFSALT